MKNGMLSLIFCVATAHARNLRVQQQSIQSSTVSGGAFNLVQMADPQLGMINLAKNTVDGFLDWANEQRMLELAATATQALVDSKKLSEDTEVIVHGDMQNWYPCDSVFKDNTCDETHKDTIGRLSKQNAGPAASFLEKFVGEEGKAETKESITAIVGKIKGKLDAGGVGVKDIGDLQKKSVIDALSKFKGDKKYLPGNHDVGDNPDAAGIAAYIAKWTKESVHHFFDHGKVAFIVLNSQVMQSDTEYAKQERALQFTWLKKQMDKINKAAKYAGVVLMMHIPPFMDSPTEVAGWGNVLQASRDKLRDIIFHEGYKLVPQLMICGHFHNNVHKTFKIASWAGDNLGKGLEGDMELVVTSAIGGRMDWGGSNGEMTPAKASEVASLPTGFAAFMQKIVDGPPTNPKPDFSLIAKRQVASPERSGVRIFEFSDAGYRHEWHTVAELPKFTGFKNEVTAWNELRKAAQPAQVVKQ